MLIANSASNWAETSLSAVAVYKGRTLLAQAILIGVIATSNLLVLGAYLLKSPERRPGAEYLQLIARLHNRRLITSVALLLVLATLSLNTASKSFEGPAFAILHAKTQFEDTVLIGLCRVSAILLLLIFACECISICYIHSKSAYQLVDACNSLFVSRLVQMNENTVASASSTWPVDSHVFELFQSKRTDWKSSKGPQDRILMPASVRAFATGNAVKTAILVVSCGVILLSSSFVVRSLPGTDLDPEPSSLRIMYLLVPFCVAVADLTASHLDARRYRKNEQGLGSDDVNYSATGTTYRLLHAVLPASTVAGWVFGRAGSTMCFDLRQTVLLAVAVLMPSHLIQTGGDNW